MRMNFDIYALTQPKTQQDILAMLQEISAELRIVSTHFEAAWARCEAKSYDSVS